MSARVEALYRSRPRSRFVQASVWAFALFTLTTWLSGVIQPGSFFTSRRLENLDRALGHFRTNLSLVPGSWRAQIPVAQILTVQEKDDEALVDFQR